MSNRMPSLLALLGLAAAAGYQNRDKIRNLMDRTLTDTPQAGAQAGAGPGADQDGGLNRLADTGLANTLRTGLAELVQRFTQFGDTVTATSWIGTGQNLAVTPVWLGTVLGNETIAELADKAGLTRVNLLSRLAQVLPDAVDRMTPEGVIPSADAGSEADRPVNQYGVGQTGSTTV